MSRFPILVVYALLVFALAVMSCSGDKSEEYRSDNTEIARFLTDDPVGQSALPEIWIDTVSRSQITLFKPAAPRDYINPSDYWVEILSHKRGFVLRDSCSADSLGLSDPCAYITLETGGTAPAKVVQIHDTLQCNYHIMVDDGDSSYIVTKPDIRLIGISYALMAQMGKNEAHYNGWNLYAIGRQRQAENYVGDLPHLDSILIRPNSGDFKYYPRARVDYEPVLTLPEIERGETFTVYVYTSPKFSGGENFYEVFLHQQLDGVVVHQRVGLDIDQRLTFSVTEESGAEAGSLRQIAVELFLFKTLRDDTPTAFGTSLFAITYKVK